MAYRHGHVTGLKRERNPARPTSDAVLAHDIAASMRVHPGRRVSDYAQRAELVALVQAALATAGHPGEGSSGE